MSFSLPAPSPSQGITFSPAERVTRRMSQGFSRLSYSRSSASPAKGAVTVREQEEYPFTTEGRDRVSSPSAPAGAGKRKNRQQKRRQAQAESSRDRPDLIGDIRSSPSEIRCRSRQERIRQ